MRKNNHNAPPEKSRAESNDGPPLFRAAFPSVGVYTAKDAIRMRKDRAVLRPRRKFGRKAAESQREKMPRKNVKTFLNPHTAKPSLGGEERSAN